VELSKTKTVLNNSNSSQETAAAALNRTVTHKTKVQVVEMVVLSNLLAKPKTQTCKT